MNALIEPFSEEMYFYYGDERIPFEWIKRQKTTRKVLIKVHPNGEITVSAPEEAQREEVLSAVKKRGRWINQQLNYFQKQQEYITPRQYISGESHAYMGRQYVLKVIESHEQPQGVKLLRGQLEVSVRTKNTENVKALLMQWYKARAKETFTKRLTVMLEQTLWVNERPPLRIQAMQTQWGSCSPKGHLTLNLYLVKAPRECIDYVLLHELCHIAEHNHSERFYRLMNQVMPRWESIKIKLDGMASRLLLN